MKMMGRFLGSAFLSLLLAVAAFAQEVPPDRVSVPFSDPSRPGVLKVHLLNGGITIKGYEGKEAVVEARTRIGRRGRSERSPDEGAGAGGMRRILNTATGLTVEEENNVISVGVGSFNRTMDLTIQVPFGTSLKLSSVNDGDIKVEKIRGDIEVNNTNGGIVMTGISGSVVAYALNGNVVVAFDEVTPNKAMSFSSMNGKIDVTLPASVKAKVSLKSDNGDIYSDFEIQMDPSAGRTVAEDGRGKGGKYVVRVDKTMHGTINGGGPEFQFKNFNGNIYIRKKS